jgi:hypothetical protein
MGMLDYEVIRIKWQCLRKEVAFVLKVTHYTSNKTYCFFSAWVIIVVFLAAVPTVAILGMEQSHFMLFLLTQRNGSFGFIV